MRLQKKHATRIPARAILPFGVKAPLSHLVLVPIPSIPKAAAAKPERSLSRNPTSGEVKSVIRLCIEFYCLKRIVADGKPVIPRGFSAAKLSGHRAEIENRISILRRNGLGDCCIFMAEIQKDLSFERRVPAPASQCSPSRRFVRPAPRRQCSCDGDLLAPPTPLASSHAFPAERVSPFQTEIWSKPWAHSHGLTLTTMSLHTMSVIFSRNGGRPLD